MSRPLTLLIVLAWCPPLSAQEVAKALELRGYLVPAQRVQVAARVPGQITEVFVKEGGLVKKGDMILRVDATPYQIDLQRAEAGLQAAEARTRQTLDAGDAVSAYEKAIAKAALLKTQADRDMARYRLDATSIRAPIDGTVLVISGQVGDSLRGEGPTAGPVCMIAELSVMDAEVDVPEREFRNVRLKQACTIRVDAFPQAQFEGVVTQIVPLANRSKGTVPVRVRFEAARDVSLFPELSATVRFRLE